MALTFEVTLDTKLMKLLMGTVEALLVQSDTALLKPEKHTLTFLMTDAENFCALQSQLQTRVTVHKRAWGARIWLVSLQSQLLNASKQKHPVRLAGRQRPDGGGRQIILSYQHQTFAVDSTEQRARIFHQLDTKQFMQFGPTFQLKISGPELDRIISQACVMSGAGGGIGHITVQKNELHLACQSANGTDSLQSIYAHKQDPEIQLLHPVSAPIHITVWLTYLKRCQLFLQTHHVILMINTGGILMQMSEPKKQTLVAIADMTHENANSYA